MSEALAQATDMVGYWAGLLMFSRFSHPWTFRLARIAIVVGEFVAMQLKRRHQRPRPSQLSPALMPPIPVPGHASYPSGHATQAYLLSGLMALVMPAVVNAPLGPAVPPAPSDHAPAGLKPAARPCSTAWRSVSHATARSWACIIVLTAQRARASRRRYCRCC